METKHFVWFVKISLCLQNGQTALNIANKLGYITVVETLKVVTETNITSTSTGTPVAEEKYKVIAPESMHETFMSDSEDEGGKSCFRVVCFSYNFHRIGVKILFNFYNWFVVIFVVCFTFRKRLLCTAVLSKP